MASDTAKIEVEPAVEEYDVYIYTGQGYSNTRITSENAEDVLGDGGDSILRCFYLHSDAG